MTRLSLSVSLSKQLKTTVAKFSDFLLLFQQNDFKEQIHSSQIFRQLFSLILFFGIWQILCVVQFNLFINFSFVPSPLEVLSATIEFIFDEPLVHIKASVFRVLMGYLIASILGITMGILIGWSQILEDLVFLPLELLRPIPAVAWIPLAILMFPSAEAGMIYITFVGAFFPILISTIRGVKNTNQVFIRVGQCLGAKQWHFLKDIVLPGALPSIINGLIIGMGTSWFCVVTAEIIAGRVGIGYVTWESYVTSNYPPIVMGMLLIGLMGSLSTLVMDRLLSTLMPWRVKSKSRA
ncbi:ABC transporter permease [Dactylococcopsis salina]|uniref:ABC-type nitrate/sulfonate/bicarbonate transport system, permease component n=1 Tax=Dactylococcopsis salina (strain PCC 8305) TaxID=13035 RepID=K9YV88_DACS8|nr:ABC transporter permease [Dactylococcopsis salina]AFZ50033.1 ABC-type nitrate/sulfonate/bicarbonate transport system, permease component [Dactylococcopsis salina PCC 8305]